jgi:hypothetical protein
MSRADIDAARWRAYLFRMHSEETLRDWGQRLTLFRFCRALGGHANDGDLLLVAYAYQSERELRSFFETLQVPLVQHSAAPPQPRAGVSYSCDEHRRFPSLIPNTSWLEQPGHCQIAQETVFVWCNDTRIELSMAEGYDVTEGDVQRAERVERALRAVALPRVDPPRSSEHCVCPEHYPELFA